MKKEEITDLVSDKFILERKVGSLVKFKQPSGLITAIKITRKDTKAMRIWGEHVNLYDDKDLQKHLGHDIDYEHADGIYCRTCQMALRVMGKSNLIEALDKEKPSEN